jgi:hypothetical protein
MKLLAEDGVVEGWDDYPAVRLTPLGERMLAGLDVIDGRAVLPPGYALVRRDSRIAPHPLNPRKDFTSPKAAEELDALRVSILEHGVRYPLEVRPAGPDGVHHIISGERRWRRSAWRSRRATFPRTMSCWCRSRQWWTMKPTWCWRWRRTSSARGSPTPKRPAPTPTSSTTSAGTRRRGRQVRAGQEARAGLPAPADPAAEVLREAGPPAKSATATPAPCSRSIARAPEPEPQLFDAEPLAPAKAADPGPRLPELSPKEALVLAELVDKAEREPAEGLEPGWTAVAETPADKVSEA